MAETVVIDVAKDFTKTPGGRYRKTGKWSGQEFREDKLQPLLDAGKRLIVDLDGPEGFTTSFLEEAFGGLVAKYGNDIMTRVTLRAVKSPRRAERALEFVERAIKAGRGNP